MAGRVGWPTLKPDDIARIITVGSPVVSPDGSLVAFVVSRLDVDANAYRSAVWLARTDGSAKPLPFTAGEHEDDNPCWSPDGTRLAYTVKWHEHDRTRAALRVAVVDGGGQPITLAATKEAISRLAWSPDGNWLAFCSRERDPSDRSEDPKRQPPRKVNRLHAKLNGEGFVIDRPRQIFVVATDGLSGPTAVTSGAFEHDAPSWSPDSDRIAFCAGRHTDWDLLPAADIWVVGRGGGEAKRQTETRLSHSLVAWGPDGRHIAALVGDDRSLPRNVGVEVLEVGTSETRLLTADLERTCQLSAGARPPAWDGDHLVFAFEDRGNVHLARVRADGSAPAAVIVGGERQVTGYDLRAGTLAFTATTSTRLAELFVLDTDGTERRITDLTDAFHHTCPSLPGERFTVRASDGAEIDAWLVRSETQVAGERLPLLLTIHGGPWTQYGNRWFDEVQLYASAGYAVLFANPRGSSGRDDEWGRAIRGRFAEEDPGTGWGGVDFTDLMAVVDCAVDRFAFVDPNRLGVLGGSYGGYMTSWIISHDDRFRAALSERAVNNVLSMEWSSDIAGLFRFEHGVDQLTKPEEYLRMSPVTYVRDINTPVLILHSEEDLRCPIEQAEQLFIALRLLGKPVEFVRFPAENHELSRSGSPVHRIQRAELVIEWFDRHLRHESPA